VSQAAINVIVGERYKEVTDQVIQYALGIWGKEAPEIMNPDVKDKILNRSRAKDWQGWHTPELTLHQLRQKYGATIPDEELLLRIYAGPDAVDSLLANGAPQPHLDMRRSLLQLIDELSRKKDCNQVYIRRNGLFLAMGRSSHSRTQENTGA
jgi:oxaloacetate decarboxylase alpha subunit